VDTESLVGGDSKRSALSCVARTNPAWLGRSSAQAGQLEDGAASTLHFISNEELSLLWEACQDKTHRHLRDRALLLVFARLGLRTEEAARLNLKDVDWKSGQVLIRSTKVRRERILPLPQEVGDGLVEHLRARPQKSPQLFAPRHPPFTEERSYNHVHNCMTAFFKRAGLPHTRVHSLRHTAATQMVNRGATFKEIADVLGHKSLTSTLIYAKLDMNALAKVCLPWPGGAQ